MKAGINIPSIRKRTETRAFIPTLDPMERHSKLPNELSWNSNHPKTMVASLAVKNVRPWMYTLFFVGGLLSFLFYLTSCDLKSTEDSNYEYVHPTVTRTGKVRKAYVRRKVSYSPKAYKSRARSRYYYHTRGKYRR
ncbi:MAG: hypothetical protein RIS20_1608 [Bacteroidota bacterium]|jgi:hypothetical protein